MPQARGEETLPGVYRLRLAMPWPEAPAGNAWALSRGDGIVLIDTGVGGDGALGHLEEALGQVGRGLDEVSLLVCTHAHADHIGLAAPIVAATGAEFRIHPAWEYIRPLGEDPAGQWEHRWEFMRLHGADEAPIDDFRRVTADWDIVQGIAEPDRLLETSSTFETDHGTWVAHHTPGHDPAHLVFHQPESRLLIGGDLLIEGAALFFEYGFTADPVAEWLGSLEVGESLEFDLCLPGHGRPIADAAPTIAASRDAVARLLAETEAIVAREGEVSAAAIATELLGPDAAQGSYVFRAMKNALAALDHLRLRSRVERIDGTPITWRPA